MGSKTLLWDPNPYAGSYCGTCCNSETNFTQKRREKKKTKKQTNPNKNTRPTANNYIKGQGINKYTNIWEVAGQYFSLIRTLSFTLPWVILGREKRKLDARAQQRAKTSQGHPKVLNYMDRIASTPLALIAKAM